MLFNFLTKLSLLLFDFSKSKLFKVIFLTESCFLIFCLLFPFNLFINFFNPFFLFAKSLYILNSSFNSISIDLFCEKNLCIFSSPSKLILLNLALFSKI